MKYNAILVLAFAGVLSCTTIKAREEKIDIRPSRYLKTENDVEKMLYGTWQYVESSNTKYIYKYDQDLGKRVVLITDNAEEYTYIEVSFEIQKNIYGIGKHLLIEYVSEEIPLYTMLEFQGADKYIQRFLQVSLNKEPKDWPILDRLSLTNYRAK